MALTQWVSLDAFSCAPTGHLATGRMASPIAGSCGNARRRDVLARVTPLVQRRTRKLTDLDFRRTKTPKRCYYRFDAELHCRNKRGYSRTGATNICALLDQYFWTTFANNTSN
jgi:hypothetical protein